MCNGLACRPPGSVVGHVGFAGGQLLVDAVSNEGSGAEGEPGKRAPEAVPPAEWAAVAPRLATRPLRQPVFVGWGEREKRTGGPTGRRGRAARGAGSWGQTSWPRRSLRRCRFSDPSRVCCAWLRWLQQWAGGARTRAAQPTQEGYPALRECYPAARECCDEGCYPVVRECYSAMRECYRNPALPHENKPADRVLGIP